MPGARPGLGHAKSTVNYWQGKKPSGFLMNDLPEGASACPS
jgi:hypothetical protein